MAKALVWKDRIGASVLQKALLADPMASNGLVAPVVKQRR